MSQIKIINSIALEDGSVIELQDADYIPGNVVRNLVRRADSVLVWAAVPPGVPDYFVSIKRNGNVVVAGTFSGNVVDVDIETGRVLGIHFVK